MKGQINVEFLAAALLYLLVLGSILTIGSNTLPDFSEDASRASLNTEAYKLTTQILKEPGYSTANGGTTDWHRNTLTVDNTIAFGLTNSSEEFNEIDEAKLNNLKSFNRNSPENFSYDNFKEVTNAENQYLFNFTWMPIVETRKSLLKDSSINLNDGLVAYYPLEDGSGPVDDVSKNNFDGVAENNVEREVLGAYRSEAFKFDGNNDYIDLGTEPDYDLVDGNFTLSAWIKTSSDSDQTILDKDNSSVGWTWRLNRESSGNYNMTLEISDYGYNEEIGHSDTSPADGEWHHVAVTWNSNTNTTTYYLDGEEDGNGTVSQKWSENDLPMHIGMRTEQNFDEFEGKIDEVRIYNKSLSLDKVKDLYSFKTKIREPKDAAYNNSGNTVNYGMKKLDSERYYFIQSTHNGLYDTAYVSDTWNFTGRNPKRSGDKFEVHGGNFTVSSFQNKERTPGSILVLSKHLKEFGPNVDSDSTVIRLDRYAVFNEEPLRIKVLVW